LASASSSIVWRHLTTLFQVGTAAGVTDGSLLERFWNGPADDAEAAFAVLVDRHGPMVLQLCRRILGDRHDAEDAAQATFLVLARQARSIRRTDSVASWLHGVAARIAARARRDAARRRARERRGAEAAMTVRRGDDGLRDESETPWPELYEELGRLPDRFRLPIVLCHLEGLTYEQAARQLGCPVRTIQSRLARGRQRLRSRLTRRGVSPAVLAPIPDLAPTTLSESWKQTTIEAAVRYAAGKAATALVPAPVAVMAEGASRAMILHRLMKWAATVLVIGVAAGGAGLAIRAQSPPPIRAQAPPPEPERHPATVPDDNRYRVTLAGRTTFEVVAVSEHTYGRSKTWWRPDGTPLDQVPVDIVAQDVYSVSPGDVLLDILVRVKDLPKDATLKWEPTHDQRTIINLGRLTKGGRDVPEYRAYVAAFRRNRTNCAVEVKLADGPWTSDTRYSAYIHGHKLHFGKGRPLQNGFGLTVVHDFVRTDNRLVVLDLRRKERPAVESSESGDDSIRLIDAEFDLPEGQILDLLLQHRPFELAEITGIALQPRPTTGPPTAKPEARPATAASPVIPDIDTDGDGLSDYQEIHKYFTDPNKVSTAGDGVPDGDRQRRREFTYTIRSVIKVMEPVAYRYLSDDYQDVRGLSHTSGLLPSDNYVQLEVIHYPHNTSARAIRGNPDWRRDAATKAEYLRPGITTNWDDAMRRDLVAALKADGIDPDRLDDKELVTRASAWLLKNSKFTNMFCTHYMHYPNGRAEIYPGLEARFEKDKGDPAWTVQEQLDRELFGRSMFVNRTHGTCTSTAVFLTTALRALGIPTRMVLGIPVVDATDPAQLEMVAKGIRDPRVRQTILTGLTTARGYANHTFLEVHVGGRWVRLNDRTLGQNILDAHLMGLLTHVNTFNDLSEVPLAQTWGKRYALGERDDVFSHGNPYLCEEVSDHVGKFAKAETPGVREHRSITITRAYWADAADAPEMIKQERRRGVFPNGGAGTLLIHGDEWIDGEPWQQYKIFLLAAGKEFLLRADGHPDVHGRTTAGSFISRTDHELIVAIPPDEFAAMTPGMAYTLIPRNEVPGYEWKTQGRVTITKNPH
jgi:RNA polymerase sigma factor (sigma-70 family)